MTGKTDSAGDSWMFTYNNVGLMASAAYTPSGSGSATITATYIYDAFGIQVEEDGWSSTGGNTTLKVGLDGWDTARPSAMGNDQFVDWVDLNGSNTLTARHMFGVDGSAPVVSETGSGTVDWYGTDQLGSVRQVFDNSGNVVSSTTFDSFGKITSGTLADRYGYTGGQLDSLTGLVGQGNGSRWYDPNSGRWYQPDPMGFGAGDANLYRYVGNDATGATDSSGMASISTEGTGAVYSLPSSIMGVAGSIGMQMTQEQNRQAAFAKDWFKAEQERIKKLYPPTNPYVAAAEEYFDYFTKPLPGSPKTLWGMAPVVGSGQEAAASFSEGYYFRGVFYTGLAISDIFLVRSIVIGVYKAGAWGVGKIAGREVAKDTVRVAPAVEPIVEKIAPSNAVDNAAHNAAQYDAYKRSLRAQSENKGPIKWIEDNPNMSKAARDYEQAAPGARPGQAPTLERTLPNGGKKIVKFDGVDGEFILIDRKIAVTTFPKSKSQALRQSQALRENGLSGRWQVPNEAEAARARKMLEELKIQNIEVEVVP